MIRRLGRGGGGGGGGRGTDGAAGAGAGLHLAVERRREGLDVCPRVQALVLLHNSNSEMGTAATKSPAFVPNKPKRMAREAGSGGAPRRPRGAS